MAIVLKHIKIYTGLRVIEDAYIRFEKVIKDIGRIEEYTPLASDETIICDDDIVVPGFIDVHTHGAYGFDTMDGDAKKLATMVNLIGANEGVTTIFPTSMTQSDAKISQAMIAIDKATALTNLIGGVHLEGPFVNPVYKGAQPEKYMLDPAINMLDHWNKLSGNRIKLVTYAPERHGAREFEKYALNSGIIPSIGHSDATRNILKESQATHITHLYNAQRGIGHREPGVTGHAMLERYINAELIVDGFHVVPDMVKFAVNVKGIDHIQLITDSMRAKGLNEGESELGGQKVIVKDKQARLLDGHLAGSVLTYDDAFRNIIKFTDIGIEDAVKMTSGNQAQEFKLLDKGCLEIGKDADLNIFNKELELLATYSYGQKLRKNG
ncbi:N-acetylglucosamine-6-phosphate deacetylase [Periweissella beninensis]|uniref:N-acetylglucosamine-6-phosphate deacetylase n=1 Tax=Periweissella beninensis TaxID=504936 RepID=UPI0021A5ED9C|nr:N-acetylglucosamine-6-phosphate deacetylase [Periweissella beninensis]MCT4395884.1 N-acetylglucosamine-6-phosphate deacetylase [Periweissella beninensis]